MAIENRFASENYVSEVLENYTKIDDLNDYAKLDNLNDYAKLNDLTDYSKLSDLNDYAKLDALNDYATTEYVDSEVERVLSLTERVKSWGAVQYYVRNGQAPYIFSIGDQLVCNSEQFGELVWDIIGFDQDIPSDSQYTHSMTLQLHNILNTDLKEFDAPEAFFVTETELNPGTYCFTYRGRFNVNPTSYYSFNIPEGIVIPIGSILIGCISEGATFFSSDLTEEYCSTTFTRTGGTQPTDIPFLGEFRYYRGNESTGGYNYYRQAGIRFFLNGENETLTEWTKQHSYDMAPSYINNPGFLYQIDPDFRKVIGPVKKKIVHPETGEYEELNDLVFLPSREEVYGIPSTTPLGVQAELGPTYTYYLENSSLDSAANSADLCRIKYDNSNVAQPWYLRESWASNAAAALSFSQMTQVACVSSSGTVTGGKVYFLPTATAAARYLAPCCCVV